MNGVSKWFMLLMAASLALNLFFLGMWSGRRWSGRDRGPRGESADTRAFLRRSGLSDAGPAVQEIVRAEHAAVRQRMQALSEARAEVRGALQAEPFDAARLGRALGNVQARTSDMQQAMHAALAALAGAVDSSHRSKMADALWPRSGFGHGPRNF